MNKRQIVGIIVTIVIIVGYFLYEQSKKTTYKEVMANLIEFGFLTELAGQVSVTKHKNKALDI
ncbi:hypothetical protein [Ferdinandcohnia sp. Marseille-Q9671]